MELEVVKNEIQDFLSLEKFDGCEYTLGCMKETYSRAKGKGLKKYEILTVLNYVFEAITSLNVETLDSDRTDWLLEKENEIEKDENRLLAILEARTYFFESAWDFTVKESLDFLEARSAAYAKKLDSVVFRERTYDGYFYSFLPKETYEEMKEQERIEREEKETPKERLRAILKEEIKNLPQLLEQVPPEKRLDFVMKMSAIV